jgi:YHS domain-containing protein
MTNSNATVHDPVCHMNIDIRDSAGRSDYEGLTYYFCTSACKLDFDTNPELVLKAEAEFDHDRLHIEMTQGIAATAAAAAVAEEQGPPSEGAANQTREQSSTPANRFPVLPLLIGTGVASFLFLWRRRRKRANGGILENPAKKVSQYGGLAGAQFDTAKDNAAGGMDKAADALREYGANGAGITGQAGTNVAKTLDRTAGYLRARSTAEMWDEVEHYVREHPTQALVEAVLAGFFIAKVLR